jgi:hypothetical protein
LVLTAHPYFLLFDDAKLEGLHAAYLRNSKKLSFFYEKSDIQAKSIRLACFVSQRMLVSRV